MLFYKLSYPTQYTPTPFDSYGAIPITGTPALSNAGTGGRNTTTSK